MAMRSQVYEYTETSGGTIKDNQTSIFTGGLGTKSLSQRKPRKPPNSS